MDKLSLVFWVFVSVLVTDCVVKNDMKNRLVGSCSANGYVSTGGVKINCSVERVKG